MEWQTQTIPHWKTNWASRRQIAAKLAVIDDRKLMSLHFLFRWFFFFNVGDVTHPCSSRSPLLCITGKIWGWSIRVQVTNQIIHPDSFFFFFTASFIHKYNWVTVVQWCLNPVCASLQGARGMKGFPWLADHHSHCWLLFSMKGTPAAVFAPTRCV